MASFTTDAFIFWAAQEGLTGYDFVASGTTQSAATPIGNADFVTVKQATALGGLLLASVANLDASQVVFITNDSAQTVSVYPSGTEVINALANSASFNVAASALGVFVRIPKHLGTIHGRTSPSSAAWSAATCPSIT